MERKAMIGAALMLVGTALLIPGLLPTTGALIMFVLVLGTALLTFGTYLVGTSEHGRPV